MADGEEAEREHRDFVKAKCSCSVGWDVGRFLFCVFTVKCSGRQQALSQHDDSPKAWVIHLDRVC